MPDEWSLDTSLMQKRCNKAGKVAEAEVKPDLERCQGWRGDGEEADQWENSGMAWHMREIIAQGLKELRNICKVTAE